MDIFPAIDLYDGKAVRLYKGDYSRMTVYSADPVSVAGDFRRAGAKKMHIVDLEGAKTGGVPNRAVIEKLVRLGGLFTEVGGGVRSMETVEAYLGLGVSRVILGTAAVEDADFLSRAVSAYGDRIAVGADARDGAVSVSGWTRSSGLTLEDFCQKLEALGVRTVICTDISRDGALRGPNVDMYKRLTRRFSLDIIASGGVSSVEDIRALKASGVSGAIIGKAYYTGDIKLDEAVREARA